MEKVAYDVHVDPDYEHDKDNKDYGDTGEDEKINGNYDRDDKKDPDEINGKPLSLLDIQDRYGINLEHEE